MTTGRIHEHLEIFENEIEPKAALRRRSGGRRSAFLALLAGIPVLETTRGVVTLCRKVGNPSCQFCVFLRWKVVIAMAFYSGHAAVSAHPGAGCLRLAAGDSLVMWLVWPVRVFLEGAGIAGAPF